MSARIITNQTPVGQRSRLAQELPLATPYMIQVFPVYACNFKCNYCIFTVPKSERGYISSQKMIDVALYRKCIDDISAFPEKLRMLRFAGTGEPLLHPGIAGMIEYASKANVAHSVDVVTNGALLTRQLALDLVNAGVNRIRISIQGVSRDKYSETTQTYSDIDQIVSNISFLYSNRHQAEIYVKIIDSALDSQKDEEMFYRLFGKIADVISVEHLLPATPLIDYTRISGKAAMDRTQNGAEIPSTEICPQPFYMLQLNPDGMVVPCCGMESPLIVGNVADNSVVDIWNGSILNQFRRTQLKGNRHANNVCAVCRQYKHAMFPEDVLDQDAMELLGAYP